MMEPVDGPIQHFLTEEVPSLLQAVAGDISIPLRAAFREAVARAVTQVLRWLEVDEPNESRDEDERDEAQM